MPRILLVLAWIAALSGSAMADGPWAGEWKVSWANGGAVLILRQTGPDLAGTYGNGLGTLSGTVDGSQFQGKISQDGVAETVTATLGSDQDSFLGYTGAGEWLSALRLPVQDAPTGTTPVDIQTPRAALRSFLDAGNNARAGDPSALASAVDVVDFGDDPAWASQAGRFTATKEFFDLIDLSTFQLSIIPEQTDETQLVFALPRQDDSSHLDLTLQQNATGEWRLLMPAAADLEALNQSVRADMRSADAFRQLQNPRDTLRAFLEGTSTWTEGGDVQATSTLDLTGIPEVLKGAQGRLAAQYLVRIIDKVGHMILQSVPNNGADRSPFIYFEHPAGRIVIEPVGTGDEVQWKFSAETVEGVRRLLTALEAFPGGHALDSGQIPYSSTFNLREKVRVYAPALLAGFGTKGRLEYWQVAGALSAVSLLFVLTLIYRIPLTMILRRPGMKVHFKNPARLATASASILAVATIFRFVSYLGLPTTYRLYTVPLFGTFLLLAITYVGWQLIAGVVSVLEKHTGNTESQLDEMLLAFVAAIARVSLLVFAGLALSHLFSVPTAGILAGFGIGGLAVAFASRETLSNIFGAGILLSDRPFQKGDHIVADDVNGLVEVVGIRSTRIRTLSGSILVVPNGTLSDATIENLGSRKHGSLATTLIVTGGATPEKIMSFIQDITARLSEDPLFASKETKVNISGITANGIQIDLSANVNTLSSATQDEGVHHLYLDILGMATVRGLSLGRGLEKTLSEQTP
jgi:small-conductance mechanosensitive channel